MEERKTDRQEASGEENKSAVRHNWVTDMYDRANLSVRQLNIILIALLTLIVALFVIFGR